MCCFCAGDIAKIPELQGIQGCFIGNRTSRLLRSSCMGVSGKKCLNNFYISENCVIS